MITRLRPSPKHYSWAHVSPTSLTTTFYPGDTNCAEVWWGSHQSGPTYSVDDPQHPIRGFPFLLKVISVGKPLSLQVHPDSSRAAILHSTFPSLYPDPNPKPEIVIATSQFRALCGLLPQSSVDVNTHGTIISGYTFKDVAYADETVVRTAVSSVKSRFPLVSLLADEYGDKDPAVLAPLFMNYVELSVGDALVIPPLEPHCYVSGEGVECMTPSDNVVRLGMTTKLCDKDTFFSLINTLPRKPTVLGSRPVYYHDSLDFKIHHLTSGSKISEHGIVLILDGKGEIGNTLTVKGDSWYVGGNLGVVGSEDFRGLLVTSNAQFSLSIGDKSSSTT